MSVKEQVFIIKYHLIGKNAPSGDRTTVVRAENIVAAVEKLGSAMPEGQFCVVHSSYSNNQILDFSQNDSQHGSNTQDVMQGLS